MDYLSYNLLNIAIIQVITSFINSAEISLSKFKAHCEENEIFSNTRLFNLTFRISENFQNYIPTIVITRYLFIMLLGLEVYSVSKNENIISYIQFDSTFLLFIILTLIILPIFVFFSYVLPRILLSGAGYRMALASLYPLLILHYLLLPIRIIITGFVRITELVTSKSLEQSQLNSEEEIRQIIEINTQAGNIEENEGKLIDNIFDFKDTTVKQVMTPRSNIKAVADDWSMSEIIEIIRSESYSRYPVFSKNLDNIIGLLHAKDMVGMLQSDIDSLPKELIRKTIRVKEDDFIDEILPEFQKQKIQLAIVIDDFGGTAGIISMEDILEEIVGEINDEHDEEEKDIDLLAENVFIVSAHVNIRELNEILPEELPESENYETIAGLIITETESIPELHSLINYQNYVFEILKRTKTKVEKVKITYSESSSINE